MIIEHYSERWALDVVRLVENFHKEAAGEYLGLFDLGTIRETIAKLQGEQADNAFLLIVDDVCQGILAGVEYKSLSSCKRIFQEVIWYVNPEFRRFGVALLKNAEKRLKGAGIDIMIMAVLENSKTGKIKSLYKRLGFKPMESHYVRTL